MENKQLITIEHVGLGHPDKVADSISDYIANWLRSVGSNETAIETMIGHGKIHISGEIDRGLKLIIWVKLMKIGIQFILLKQC